MIIVIKDVFPINSNFDKFCKNCIGGFGLFVVTSICLEAIYISSVHTGNAHAISALSHILHTHLCLLAEAQASVLIWIFTSDFL